jgi:hypothetical protein
VNVFPVLKYFNEKKKYSKTEYGQNSVEHPKVRGFYSATYAKMFVFFCYLLKIVISDQIY